MTDPIKKDDSVVVPPVVVPPADPSKDKVAYATFQRVLDEAKKAKDELKVLRDEKAAMTESTLKQNNEWKTLYEQAQEKLKTTEQTLTSQEEAINNGIKFSAFEKQLGGKLLHPDYSAFVDFSKIVINPESKTVDEDSVKLVVADFTKNHSQLVKFTGTPKIPNQAPKAPGSMGQGKSLEEMTAEETREYIIKQAEAGLIK